MNGKRWMALLLALVMSFSLFACGAKPAENTGDNSQNTAAMAPRGYSRTPAAARSQYL